jgi:hypothetical protein
MPGSVGWYRDIRATNEQPTGALATAGAGQSMEQLCGPLANNHLSNGSDDIALAPAENP